MHYGFSTATDLFKSSEIIALAFFAVFEKKYAIDASFQVMPMMCVCTQNCNLLKVIATCAVLPNSTWKN